MKWVLLILCSERRKVERRRLVHLEPSGMDITRVLRGSLPTVLRSL